MPNTPGTLRFPANLDDTDSLIRASNNAATMLTAAATSSDATLTVESTSSFAPTGALTIDGEIVFYTGTTSTTFTGCVRGQDGTAAATHAVGAKAEMLIVAAHHNLLASGLAAAESKIGSGASTPVAGTFLQGTGAGSSTWVSIPSYLELNLSGVGSTVTLSAEQCRQPRIILQGSLTSDVTVEFLNLHQVWTIEDTTTRNGYRIYIRKTGGSSRELYAGEIADFRASGV